MNVSDARKRLSELRAEYNRAVPGTTERLFLLAADLGSYWESAAHKYRLEGTEAALKDRGMWSGTSVQAVRIVAELESRHEPA